MPESQSTKTRLLAQLLKWLLLIGTVFIEMMVDGRLSCVVERKFLQLQKETGQTYRWKIVADNTASNPQHT